MSMEQFDHREPEPNGPIDDRKETQTAGGGAK